MRCHPVRAGAALVVTVALALGLARAGQPPRVGVLIDQLGGDSFIEREEARKQLAAIGLPALPALQQAAKCGNLELARRATALIAMIEERRTTTAILAPTRLRLKVESLPVLDAVAQLSKLAGYPVRVDGDRTVLASKRVTLDTGLVSFWEALDQLGAQAGLIEKCTIPGLPGEATVQPSAVSQPFDLCGALGQKVHVRRPRANPPLRIMPLEPTAPAKQDEAKNEEPKQDGPPLLPTIPGLVILTPGKVAGPLVHYAGAVRVGLRPAPAAPPVRGKAPPAYHDVVVEVSAEPRLLGFAPGGVPAITRAIDEHGEALTVILDPPGARPVRRDPNESLRGILMAPAPTGLAPRSFTVRVPQGAKRATKLRELAGTLSAQVLLPRTPLAVIDNVGKAEGKTVDLKGGGRMQLDKVTKLAAEASGAAPGEDAYTAILKLDGLPGMDNAFTYVLAGNRIVTLNRGADLAVELFDARGQRLALVSGPAMQQEVNPDTQAIKHVMTTQFRRAKGQGEPARLVFSGTHAAPIAVPFRFVDVPLP